MPWDANIASNQFKGKLPLQSFNQLQAAIKERCLGAGISVPSAFNADMTKTDMLPSNWFTLFQSQITTLIPLYANHTDNSGNWNGQATIPAWTEASILTAISDVSRLAVPSAPSHRICAKWCYQQYKILNLLRWNRKVPTNPFNLTGYRYAPFRTSWANAVTDWNALGWTSVDDNLARIVPHASFNNNNSQWGIVRQRGSLPPFTNNTGFDVASVHYCYFYNTWDVEFEMESGNPDKVFEDNDYASTEDTYQTIATATINNGGSYTPTFGYFDTITATEPFFIAPYTSGINSYQIKLYTGIFKFDGASGFTYKDW